RAPRLSACLLPFLLIFLGWQMGWGGEGGTDGSSPCGPSRIFVSPRRYGGTVRLKCKTTCQDPSTTGNVETSFYKKLLNASGPDEKVVELRNITDHELVCRVPRVAPVRNLTVILRRGATTLHTATFEDSDKNEPQDVVVMHLVTAERGDQGQNITCQALLDLQPSNVHFNTTSSPQVLDVYGELAPVSPRTNLETDQKFNVSCSVRDVFPAPRFNLSLAGCPLPFHVTEDGLRAVAEVSHAQQGRFEVVCSVWVGRKERWQQALVHVYSFPQPQLNINTSVPREGTEVSGGCVLPPGHSPGLQLQVTAGPRVLAAWGPSPLGFTWKVSEEDNGTEVVCEARMPARGVMSPGVPTALPKIDDGSCPPSQNWTEGEEVTLRCQARGNPWPHVVCDKDGTRFIPGQWHRATRAHSGTFRCEASNALGTAKRNITVWVQYHDINVGLIVAVVLVVLGALASAGIAYGVYHRKKKVREYQLQKEQRRMEMQKLRPEETVGINGSAPGSQP
uniref:Ig-like domain-containing protein n=1 Tax=Cairina moschata TaxID=8855 RepID=A0A8C3CB89_CAIMO